MGILPEADILAKRAGDGAAFGEELRRIGWQGEADPAALQGIGAYLELHIEQGPVLEDEGYDLGIVTGVQGVRWYEAAITGRESHAGTTPMPRRADAMVACARLALEVQKNWPLLPGSKSLRTRLPPAPRRQGPRGPSRRQRLYRNSDVGPRGPDEGEGLRPLQDQGRRPAGRVEEAQAGGADRRT